MICITLGSYCLQHLLEWVRCHFNEADILGQNVMSSDDPYSHQDYWPTVGLFTLNFPPQIIFLILLTLIFTKLNCLFEQCIHLYRNRCNCQ